MAGLSQPGLCWKPRSQMFKGKMILQKLLSFCFSFSTPLFNFVLLFTQPKNIKKICHRMVKETEKACPQLVPEARQIKNKFRQLFTLFGTCHFMYNSGNPMSDEQIVLGKILKQKIFQVY